MDRQPPDLSLAVGNGARRMTYGELAQARGAEQQPAPGHSLPVHRLRRTPTAA
jgi:hypothetical protein